MFGVSTLLEHQELPQLIRGSLINNSNQTEHFTALCIEILEVFSFYKHDELCCSLKMKAAKGREVVRQW